MTPTAPHSPAAHDVAIIGGGAAGTLVAVQLLRQAPGPLAIAIVEPRPAPGRGVAYSTLRPEHRLNVIASRMSAFDDAPEDFADFLAANPGGDSDGSPLPPGPVTERFARRRDYARYLQATLAESPNVDGVVHVSDVALDLGCEGDAFVLPCASGSLLRARRVVLATGNGARGLPLAPAAISGAPRVIEAWDYAAVAAIDADRDVCIVGSGLSMVDAVLTLDARCHRGRITVLSRHGLMPLAHAAAGRQAGGVDDLLHVGMRTRMALLRQRARDAAGAGVPWQWTMDALRHYGQTLWRASDDAERRRFLRHAQRLWDIHRHRIAPDVAAVLEALRADGRLQVQAGRLTALCGDDAAAVLEYRPRGADAGATLTAGCVVNATGVDTTLARSGNPLLRAMHGRGLLQPGPLGMGIATDDHGAVLQADGSVVDGVATLGAPRIGALWESLAVPELRGQAQALAARMLAADAGAPPSAASRP